MRKFIQNKKTHRINYKVCKIIKTTKIIKTNFKNNLIYVKIRKITSEQNFKINNTTCIQYIYKVYFD